MTGTLLDHLAPFVAAIFPVHPGETFNGYIARAKAESAERRAFIAALVRNRQPAFLGMPPDERDALARLGVRFVDLFTALPNWNRGR